jgi:hypothetical protein
MVVIGAQAPNSQSLEVFSHLHKGEGVWYLEWASTGEGTVWAMWHHDRPTSSQDACINWGKYVRWKGSIG